MPEPAPRDKLKQKMLEVAEHLLETEGLAAVQARRVASDAGCSVGTLYNVFKGGLDDLIIEANDRTLRRLGAELEHVVANGGGSNPHEALLLLGTAYVRFATQNTRRWRAVFEHRLPEDQSVPDWYRENQAELFGKVESVLKPLGLGETERKRAARALFSAVHGIVSISLDRKLGEFDPVETEQQVKLVVGAAARGLAN